MNYVSHKAPLLLVSVATHSTVQSDAAGQVSVFYTLLLFSSAPWRDLFSELGTVSGVFSFKQNLDTEDGREILKHRNTVLQLF